MKGARTSRVTFIVITQKSHLICFFIYVFNLPYFQGCKDAGRVIFSHPIIKAVAERYFVPAAFNTWDRSKPQYAQAFRAWSAGLNGS
jgi:hypothetical protein